MNQFFRWGVLATALIVLAGGTASVQAQGQPSLAATKVGTVNIGLLFTKYKKAEIMKKELENELAPLKAEAEKIKSIVQSHIDYLKKFGEKADPAQAETSRKAVKDGERALEDLDMRARKQIGKKQETQLIQLYKEIHAAVQMYAQQNGYHVVMAYGDPSDQDLFTFQNINRKMMSMDSGAAVLYYTQTNLDISQDVLARLNAMYAGGGGAAPTAPITPVGFGGQPQPPR